MEKDIERVGEFEDVPDEHLDESEIGQEEISEIAIPEVYGVDQLK